jgi:hypothetical protein
VAYIAISTDFGDLVGQSIYLDRLGDTHHAAGNTTAARAAWQQALIILTNIDHPTADTVSAKLNDPTAPPPPPHP